MAWLAQASDRWGAFAGVLESLGMFHLFRTPLFRATLAWAAALCVARVVQRPARPHSRAWCAAAPGGAAQVWDAMRAALRELGLVLKAPTAAAGCQIAVARRAGPRAWLPSLGYVGVLLLLSAAVVGWRWGWRGDDVTLLLGETRSLDGPGEIGARLDEVILTLGGREGGPRVDSRLTLTGGGQTSEGVATGPHRSARFAGASLYQVGDGPAARVQVREAKGRTFDITEAVGSQPSRQVARVAFSDSQQERLLVAPAADLVIRMVRYASLPSQGISGPALHVQLSRWSSGQALAESFLGGDGTLRAVGVDGELVVDVALEAYVVLRAEREPELPLAVAGGLLALLGLLSAILWPERRVHVALRARDAACDVRLQVATQGGASGWLPRLEAALSALPGAWTLSGDPTPRTPPALYSALALLLLAQTVGLAVHCVLAQRASGSYWGWAVAECWQLAAWLATALVCVGIGERGWGQSAKKALVPRGPSPEPVAR
jgi:hypothetical protein